MKAKQSEGICFDREKVKTEQPQILKQIKYQGIDQMLRMNNNSRNKIKLKPMIAMSRAPVTKVPKQPLEGCDIKVQNPYEAD